MGKNCTQQGHPVKLSLFEQFFNFSLDVQSRDAKAATEGNRGLGAQIQFGWVSRHVKRSTCARHNYI